MSNFLFNKVLVAVDDSEQSARAVEMAIKFAKASQAGSIVIFNAYDTGNVDFTKLHSVEKLDAIKAASLAILQKYEARFNEQGLYCQLQMRKGGEPSELILEIVKADPEFDLIMVGSRKINKLQELTSGSVSDRITRLSSVPVLVIK